MEQSWFNVEAITNNAKSRRRSSLFQINVEQNEAVLYTSETDFQHNYPSDYIQKLDNELILWEKNLHEHNSRVKDKAQKYASKKILGNEILNNEQLDFLSSLVDYNQYQKCVIDFSNKFETAYEKLIQAKEDILSTKADLDRVDKMILESCKRYF